MDTSSSSARPLPRRRLQRRTLAIAALIALGALAAVWQWQRTAPPPAPAAASPRPADEPVSPSMLRIATVHAEPMPLAEPLPARLGYDEDHTTRVLPAWSGRLSRVDVSIGDPVKAGQRLAEVDSPDFGSARADLGKAEADLALKRKALERSKALLDAQVIARKDAEQAEADAAQAEAEAQRARLRVANLLPRGHAGLGEQLPLTTPMAGWVTERAATPGQELGNAGGAPLFVVSDLRRLWLTIDLPEHLLSHVRVGDEVRLKVDAWPDAVFTARIDRIGLTVDPATRRVPVRALIDNPGLKLKPEMYAQVSMPGPEGARGIPVPNSALVSQGYDTLLYVQRAPGQYDKRLVHIGLRGATSSYVTDGLRDGETVVVQGALLLGAQLAEAPTGGQQP